MSENQYQIDISVVSIYLPEQSQPEYERFAFAYTVSISNSGSVNTKLISRHWIITDGNGNIEEVRGTGVVGQQPLIKSGQTYTYSSGSVLSTRVGVMQGEYTMLDPDNQEFRAFIKPFRLVVPGTLQ